jgi:ribosome maturation factor RimP
LGQEFGGILRQKSMSLISDTRQADQIVELIEPALADMGLEIVRVLFKGGDQTVLQVMLDRADGERIDVDDCSDASRTISALLDVADPVPGSYDLEVSSPGIDRPLTRAKDFELFAGFEARVELAQAQDGQRRYVGRLKGLIGDDVCITSNGKDIALPLAAIAKAKLVLTDELIKKMATAAKS